MTNEIIALALAGAQAEIARLEVLVGELKLAADANNGKRTARRTARRSQIAEPQIAVIDIPPQAEPARKPRKQQKWTLAMRAAQGERLRKAWKAGVFAKKVAAQKKRAAPVKKSPTAKKAR